MGLVQGGYFLSIQEAPELYDSVAEEDYKSNGLFCEQRWGGHPK